MLVLEPAGQNRGCFLIPKVKKHNSFFNNYYLIQKSKMHAAKKLIDKKLKHDVANGLKFCNNGLKLTHCSIDH